MCRRALCLWGVVLLMLAAPVTAPRAHTPGGHRGQRAVASEGLRLSRIAAQQRLAALAELPEVPSASEPVPSPVLCFCLAKAGETLQEIRRRAIQHFNQGIAAVRAHQYERAIGAFAHAIALNPQDARGYAHRDFAYGRLGQYRQALADLSRALTLEPQAAVYYLRGLIYVLLGETERARADLARAARAGYAPARAVVGY